MFFLWKSKYFIIFCFILWNIWIFTYRCTQIANNEYIHRCTKHQTTSKTPITKTNIQPSNAKKPTTTPPTTQNTKEPLLNKFENPSRTTPFKNRTFLFWKKASFHSAVGRPFAWFIAAERNEQGSGRLAAKPRFSFELFLDPPPAPPRPPPTISAVFTR